MLACAAGVGTHDEIGESVTLHAPDGHCLHSWMGWNNQRPEGGWIRAIPPIWINAAWAGKTEDQIVSTLPAVPTKSRPSHSRQVPRLQRPCNLILRFLPEHSLGKSDSHDNMACFKLRITCIQLYRCCCTFIASAAICLVRHKVLFEELQYELHSKSLRLSKGALRVLEGV